jgi:hypothetical protein
MRTRLVVLRIGFALAYAQLAPLSTSAEERRMSTVLTPPSCRRPIRGCRLLALARVLRVSLAVAACVLAALGSCPHELRSIIRCRTGISRTDGIRGRQ